MPRSQDLGGDISDRQTDRTDYFIPCTCAWGNKSNIPTTISKILLLILNPLDFIASNRHFTSVHVAMQTS